MRMYTQKELVKLLEDSIVNRKCVKINDVVCEPYLIEIKKQTHPI